MNQSSFCPFTYASTANITDSIRLWEFTKKHQFLGMFCVFPGNGGNFNRVLHPEELRQVHTGVSIYTTCPLFCIDLLSMIVTSDLLRIISLYFQHGQIRDLTCDCIFHSKLFFPISFRKYRTRILLLGKHLEDHLVQANLIKIYWLPKACKLGHLKQMKTNFEIIAHMPTE